jgi:uncharacterized protein
MSGAVFNILAIDGGGIRGVFPAHILQCISERLAMNIAEHFGMIAGTSTGSIIAASIACNVEPERIVSLYREHGQDVFAKKAAFCTPRFVKQALWSLYDSVRLGELLRDLFGETKLGAVSVPLLLPATDIGNGSVHVFKSGYSGEFTRDKDVLVREAVLASCSAPTFFDPTRVQEYLLADGGLWANNPSLAAVVDAQHRLKVALSSIRVLSLGTGHARSCYGVRSDKQWGLMRGWGGPGFVNFILSLQAQSTQNYLQLILNEDQLLRLDFESDRPLPLDDCSAVEDLISRADRVFTHNSQRIAKFFDTD